MSELRTVGSAPDGSVVHELKIASDRLHLRLLTYGARIHRLSFDGSGDLVRGAEMADYIADRRYASPIVGPVVNRLAGARVSVEGVDYMLEANQKGRHSLHSGSQGAHARVWDVVEHGPDRAVFALSLKDGDCGLPGNRTIRAEYRVEGDALHLGLEGTTDRPTLMNLALHGLWNMDASDDWSGHRLTVPTGRATAIDEDIIPTGEVIDVGGTEFDLRDGPEPPRTIDHNYCFDPAFGHRATLTGASGRSLTLYADGPGLQVFTMKPATIALEPQFWPDAPHHPHFPSILLRPGETFRQASVYRFSGTPQND